MKIDPITSTKPTIADLAKGFNQLHECHEDTKETVETIARALKLDEHGKTVAGLSSPRQAFLRTFTAVTSAIVALGVTARICIALWPWVLGAGKTLWALLANGKV